MTPACDTVRRQLDLYLDRELPQELMAGIAAHLASCGACAAELQEKSTVRDRLRTAVKNVPAPAGLERRIRGNPRDSRPASWSRTMLTIAAAVLICVSTVIAYRSYPGRMSQDDYVASLSGRVSPIMRVGLGDHIHCAVFRKYPKDPPTVSQMVSDMGPEYKDLLRVVQDRIPPGYRVMMAHRCGFNGRVFVHLTATDGWRLVSLVVSRKGPGESFEASRLGPALVRSGIPIYRSGVDRFEMAGFETRDHLVYVVSDAGARGAVEMMAVLAPEVRDALSKIES